MEATDLYIQDIFAGEDQYIVPVFQRRYSWEEEHWEAFWEDLSELLESELGEEDHFIGAFVVMSRGNRPGSRPQYLVIDGQQRLITLSIILAAIRDKASEIDFDTVSILSDKQRNELEQLSEEIQKKHLVDPFQDDWERYRLISRAEDRDALFGVLDGEGVSEDTSIGEAYSYFADKIEEMISQEDVYELKRLKGLIMEQLPFAMITASEDENPYTIFETLNERGLRLEESDLIRNYVFMKLDIDDQDEFNDEKWQPFEQKFSETDSYDSESLTRFYRMYLMRKGNYVKKNNVYSAFRDRVEQSPHDLADELDYYSDLYLTIRRPSTADTDWLREALQRIQYLDIGTADPLILHLLNRWQSNDLGDYELKKIFKGVESFAIRRSICGESTRGYYQIFPSAIRSINDESVVSSLFSYLGGRGWPDDEEFRSAFVTFDLYSREHDKCRLILETLQRDYGHKEPVELENLQIEHVMPQEISEDEHGQAWKTMLGDDWENVHEEWKHTPGNLTLTGYNPELSNNKFEDKQELFEESKIDLNDHFLEVDQWTPIEIRDRGEELARRVANLWPVPESVRTDESSLDSELRMILLDEGIPTETFEGNVQIQVIKNGVAYLIREKNLLDRISIPYFPGTGEGYRAFLNSEPKHADGSEMGRYVEINDLYLYSKLSAVDKMRYFRELARKCGLVCRFEGEW
ncbi:MAG: DUF262 domain-containing protein [Halobacteriaceae archaeon]